MLARGLFAAGSAHDIVALRHAEARAFMHLDTVMTMVDADTFTQYAGLGMLRSYTIEPGDAGSELKVTDHAPEQMHRAIAAALGLDAHRVLTAMQDVHSASASSGTTAATCWPSSPVWSSPTSATSPRTRNCARTASR